MLKFLQESKVKLTYVGSLKKKRKSDMDSDDDEDDDDAKKRRVGDKQINMQKM